MNSIIEYPSRGDSSSLSSDDEFDRGKKLIKLRRWFLPYWEVQGGTALLEGILLVDDENAALLQLTLS